MYVLKYFLLKFEIKSRYIIGNNVKTIEKTFISTFGFVCGKKYVKKPLTVKNIWPVWLPKLQEGWFFILANK